MSIYLSEKLEKLSPYTPGEQPKGQKFIKLNTNESPFPPAPEVLMAAKKEAQKLNLYSDPTASDLKAAIADYYGVNSRNVFVSNGSDEALAFAFQAYGDKGFQGPEVSYGFYPVFASLYGIDYKKIPLKDDLSIDLDGFLESERAIVFANPNAGTGLYFTPKEIEEFLEKTNAPVILDEAYIDFGGETAVPLTKKFKNLLITGTFSKSRNLAGARIGFAIGNSELIADLERIKYSFNPYNLNRISIAAGVEAIKNEAYFRECTEAIKRNREYTRGELIKLGFEVTDSRANFLLCRSQKQGGEELYKALKEKGILIRYLGDERIRDYVRITIGSLEEMKTLIKEIRDEICRN